MSTESVRAVHATTVAHYSHVLGAMRDCGFTPHLVSRLQFSEQQFEIIRRLPLPSRVIALAERRLVADEADFGRGWIGPAEFAHPIFARTPFRASPKIKRMVDVSSARNSRRFAKDAALFHFISGLGYESLRLKHGRPRIAVCERRDLHHRFFERELEPVIDCPVGRAARDPMADLLDEEYEQADAILVYSEVAKRTFVQEGFSKEKIFVYPLGVTPGNVQMVPWEGLGAEIDEPLVAYVGRNSIFKGLDVAVAAVQQLGGRVRLQVAGALGAETAKWLREQPHVDYLGIVSRQQLSLLYAKSICLIAPTFESFGLAVLDAAKAGVPVLTKDTTGIGEYLYEKEHPWVLDNRDPVLWAGEIESILSSETEDIRQLSTCLRRKADELTWFRSREELGSHYEDLLRVLEGVK